MLNFIWSKSFFLYWLLLPFSCLYGLITACIRFSYRCGWRKVYRFPIPIVVIGNLTLGGNGKTPLVLWLVVQLQKQGWRVGIVSRGYGGRANYYPILLDSTTTSKECGDEPLLLWQRTGLPIAVAPRRIEAVAALLRTQSLDVVVSDDGLQHYALGRDIEWVVIDGKHRFYNGWWLPAGPLRERATRLKTVQAIIVNGGDVYPGEVSMHLVGETVVNLLSGERRSLSSFSSIVAIAGIAHPTRFFHTLHLGGVTPLREVAFSDHQVYRQHMIDVLVKPEEDLIMTEKDAVKCQAFSRANWWYLPVDVHFPQDVEKSLLSPILQAIYLYQSKKDKSKKA
ncbi:tetraacyldisaccharide 4'-kinase [secondary endosymbiont of Heteropsylla cubana]|uniref:tetraacyldisaccharide 4'-kinase n=1 Tax=secondary endosymbiont of Heteropsylla cubana TaxID=134287 RepID=UPI0005C75B5F|nr:tetraacyldisaccharide 4'-kinase [secondary endosymbiont of Heteropsylla cubana]